MDRDFVPPGPEASYFPEEIAFLKDKSPEKLKRIHKVKLAFPGRRVIQEGPEVT